MQNNVESKNRISQSTFNFINTRIDSVINELSKVEMDIRNFKQDYKITDMKSESENLYKASGDILDKKRNAEVQVELINAIISYMTSSKDPTITLPANLLENGGIKTMIDRFNSLHTEIETSLISNTENNPATKNLIRQQNEIKQNILSMLASTRDNLKLEAAKYQEKLDEINGRIHQVPEVEMKYLDYSRRETLKNDMYVFLLKKREETAIEMSATQPNAAIIDPASFAGQIAPDHARILMMSFLFGLTVPFGVIVLRRALNIKIISKADVTKLTTIPVIGEIGNNSSEDYVAVTKNSRSIISEQFRALRTNLQYLLTDKKEKVLMVTSSMGGEGKSFIAVNMAITLAMSGKKVVLIEMDLRKPKISKMLNLDNSIGFSNYAIGRAEIDDVVVPSGVDANLYILGSGPVPPNPSELILLPRTEEMFRQLREKFDYVIVDTSPVGMVTDAQLINKYADTAIYIIRQGLTYKQQLNIPNELYHSGRIARLSIVINDVLANRGFAYGYGYEEGYGYSYGNGYGYGYGYGYGSYGNGYYLEEKKKGIKDWFNVSKNK
jgi:capsular exopolysaccharide synthesis family protein